MELLTCMLEHTPPQTSLFTFYLQSAIRPSVWDIDGQVETLKICNVVQDLIPNRLNLTSGYII